MGDSAESDSSPVSSPVPSSAPSPVPSLFSSRVARLTAALGGALLVVGAYDPELWSWMVAGAVLLGIGTAGCWLRRESSWSLVLGGAVLARLALFPLEPSLSDDAFRYVWDGLVQLQGLNPYLYVPADPALEALRGGELFSQLNSPERYTVYPPVSQLVFGASALFYEADARTAYYVMKAFMTAFDLGTIALLTRMVSARAVLLYAWNPLVLLELTGQGHEEAIMVFFLVATAYLLRTDRDRWAVCALTLAGWVKLYPFFLMPLLLNRTGWKRIWVAVLTSGLVWIPYAEPGVLEHILESLRLYVQLFEFNAGPYYLVKQIFYAVTGADWSKQIGPTFAGLFLASLPITYWWDRHASWTWSQVAVGVTGTYFALATTVHPWYLTGILALLPLLPRAGWHWIWLGIFSVGTYLFYVDGAYWPFVIAGWTGWALGGLYYHRRTLLEPVLRLRARGKWALIEPYLERSDRLVLDVGAGEGYVAELLASEGHKVELVDVEPLGRTELPYRVYDGRTLPYEEGTFDAALLVYVLHHSREPEQLLREALRVSDRAIIVESVYVHPWEHRFLRWADRWANRLRSDGRTRDQETDLQHRTDEEWRTLFRRHGRLVHHEVEERGPHHRAVYVVEPEASRA